MTTWDMHPLKGIAVVVALMTLTLLWYEFSIVMATPFTFCLTMITLFTVVGFFLGLIRHKDGYLVGFTLMGLCQGIAVYLITGPDMAFLVVLAACIPLTTHFGRGSKK